MTPNPDTDYTLKVNIPITFVLTTPAWETLAVSLPTACSTWLACANIDDYDDTIFLRTHTGELHTLIVTQFLHTVASVCRNKPTSLTDVRWNALRTNLFNSSWFDSLSPNDLNRLVRLAIGLDD
jgi:hypothetical protein